MKRRNGPEPDVVVEVYLVPHGIQADLIFNNQRYYSICQDFAGEYQIDFLAQDVMLYILNSIDKFMEGK